MSCNNPGRNDDFIWFSFNCLFPKIQKNLPFSHQKTRFSGEPFWQKTSQTRLVWACDGCSPASAGPGPPASWVEVKGEGFVKDPWVSSPIYWVWPLPSNSDHQDYYIFSRESRTKPLFATVIGKGPHPTYILINGMYWGCPKMVDFPNNHGVFLLKMIMLGCFGGYHHLRKHPWDVLGLYPL